MKIECFTRIEFYTDPGFMQGFRINRLHVSFWFTKYGKRYYFVVPFFIVGYNKKLAIKWNEPQKYFNDPFLADEKNRKV